MASLRLALTVGDPAGIGPEIVHACLQDRELVHELGRLVVLGPEALRPEELTRFHDPAAAVASSAPVVWISTGERGSWEPGRAQASAGRAAVAALRAGAQLAAAGTVDALVTAPVSKEALHLAGERVEGQTELLARWDGAERVGMLAVAEGLRVMPLTRHLPLKEALDSIDRASVRSGIELLAEGLRRLGFERPRLALAGLNPHAGEAGLLGSDENDHLRPAANEMRSSGLDVEGPLPPDTVFLRAAAGEFDAVLAMYHDQAFIPVKLLAPGKGLTVLLGLSYIRVSPAHGTAFDIAGKGRADASNLALALRQAATWARQSAEASKSSRV